LPQKVTPEGLPMAVILVVEDDVFIREVAEMMIRDWGHQTLAACDVDEALSLLRSPQHIAFYRYLPQGSGPWRVRPRTSDRRVAAEFARALHDRQQHHRQDESTESSRSPTMELARRSAELALAAIILFYVVEMLTMPANMKRVCQGLIVLIAILSVIGVLLGSAPPPASHVGPLAPNSPSNPSTIR